MKSKTKGFTILSPYVHNGYLHVNSNESNKHVVLRVPEHLRCGTPVSDDKGRLWIGEYRYNQEEDTWEKISKILMFLKGIMDLIKNIFNKK